MIATANTNPTAENPLKEIKTKMRKLQIKLQLISCIVAFIMVLLTLVSAILLLTEVLSLPDALELKKTFILFALQSFLFPAIFIALGCSEFTQYIRDKYPEK